MRKGRFDKKEMAFIKENHKTLPIDEISRKLNRDPESVQKYINQKLGKNTSVNDVRVAQAEYDLKNRLYWKDLTQQFSPEELEMILFHWGRMISQFRDDVLPTEELQVLDAIKLEILMGRCLKEQQSSMQDIADLEVAITDEKARGVVDQDTTLILNLERQVAVLRASQESLSKDYKDLQSKKGGMLKDLKATREQRIKRLEDSKETFVGWIKMLIDDPEFSRGLGVAMEKMRMSSENEKARLSEYHQYEDGGIDQPFLTPETVKDD